MKGKGFKLLFSLLLILFLFSCDNSASGESYSSPNTETTYTLKLINNNEYPWVGYYHLYLNGEYIGYLQSYLQVFQLELPPGEYILTGSYLTGNGLSGASPYEGDFSPHTIILNRHRTYYFFSYSISS